MHHACCSLLVVTRARVPSLPLPDPAGQVLGVRGSEYKSFSSEQAARQYLQQRGVEPGDQQAQQAQQAGQPGAAQPVGPAATAASAGGGEGGPQCKDPQARQQSRAHFNSPDAAGAAGRRAKGGAAGATRQVRPGAGGGAAARPAKRASPGGRTEKSAWEQAAAAWREKNRPSDAEMKRAVREQRAAAAAYEEKRQRRTPLDHIAVERGSGARKRPSPAERAAAARAREEAAADSRARARSACRRKIEGCSSFVQVGLVELGAGGWGGQGVPAEWSCSRLVACRLAVLRLSASLLAHRKPHPAAALLPPPAAQLLRIFGVPTDPARLRDAYRTAVRMYHPDSNSRDRVGGRAPQRAGGGTRRAVCAARAQGGRAVRGHLPASTLAAGRHRSIAFVPPAMRFKPFPCLCPVQAWRTEDEKFEAEEVMKIINERKPADL